MFGVEQVLDRGQADILVDAPVAGDVVRIEQFIVVKQVLAGLGVERDRVAGVSVGVGCQGMTP